MGNNFSYYWDFGDGLTDTTHTLTSFTHTYYTGIIRNYTIRLISRKPVYPRYPDPWSS